MDSVSLLASFSPETLLPFGVGALFLAFFSLIIWAAVVQTRKARENLQGLAASLGLAVQEPASKGIVSTGQRRVIGAFRGRAVQIYTYTTGSGKNRSTWCALTVVASVPTGFSLKITGENLFTKAGRMIGFDDVKTGDSAFDERFYVKSAQSDYVRAALIPEVRTRLLEAWKTHRPSGAFTVENGQVKYNELGNFANTKLCQRFPAMLEIACELAEIGEAWRGE